ncbi:MAG TPA: phosphatase PAP2 family protein [Ignavibacteria bacterium]|nr:phosphatase PAP2 family protein [Ignavibacteria bacterium]
MVHFLYSIDLSVFYFFNHTLSSGVLNRFFTTITNVNNWYIVYILLLYISFFKGGRRGKIAAIGVILLITFSDQFGANVLKEWVQRIRPCNALSNVITPLGCNGTYSFPSNHALNNFAAAMFYYRLFPKLKWALFITATLIAISRVYIGVHYPSDILGGAIIGAAIGYVFSIGALRIEQYLNKNPNKMIFQKK